MVCPPSSDQSDGRSPIPHSFGGPPSAVFWYSQLPQIVQFQLLLIFFMLLGGSVALTPEAARSPCGGTLVGFSTISRQALQGLTTVSPEFVRGIGACRIHRLTH